MNERTYAENPVAPNESATRAGATEKSKALVKEALMAGSAATRAGSYAPAFASASSSSSSTGLAAVVDHAAKSLRSPGGGIHYLGGGAAGVLGLIDASEQVPTFGARQVDVQGWIDEGWTGLHLVDHIT